MTFTKSLFLAAAMFAAAPALAQSADKQMAVSYDDLNLQNPSGARALLSRIAAAAREVCGPRPSIHELSQLRAYYGCVKDATDRAVASVGLPVLADTYRGTLASR